MMAHIGRAYGAAAERQLAQAERGGRYARQEILEGIGEEGQRRLGKAAVAVVGLGALGTVAADLLCRAGVGRLILVDRDVVELSNLQRQALYAEADVGLPKAERAAARLAAVNSRTVIEAQCSDLAHDNISRLLAGAGLVLDCTDSLETRFLINERCLDARTPWIYGAALGWEGYAKLFLPGGACFRCHVAEAPNPGTCDTVGVLNALAAVIGSMQAAEAIKLIAGVSREGEPPLLHYSARDQSLRALTVERDRACPACARGERPYLSGKRASRAIRLCGSGVYQVKGAPADLALLERRLRPLGTVAASSSALRFTSREAEFTVFGDGRALIRAESEGRARAVAARYLQ